MRSIDGDSFATEGLKRKFSNSERISHQRE